MQKKQTEHRENYTTQDVVKDIVWGIFNVVLAFGWMLLMLLIISFVTLGVIHFEIEKMILISAIAAAVMFVYRVVILILKYMR